MESDKKRKKQLPPSLRIGDIIYLNCNLVMLVQDPNGGPTLLEVPYKGRAQGAGMARSNLFSIPARDKLRTGFSADTYFMKCLFQVQPIKRQKWKTMLSELNEQISELRDVEKNKAVQNVLREKETMMALYKVKVRDELIENKEEFRKSMGSPVLYG